MVIFHSYVKLPEGNLCLRVKLRVSSGSTTSDVVTFFLNFLTLQSRQSGFWMTLNTCRNWPTKSLYSIWWPATVQPSYHGALHWLSKLNGLLAKDKAAIWQALYSSTSTALVLRTKFSNQLLDFFSWNWGWTFLICIGNAGAIDAGAHHWTSQRLASCTACRRCVWPILISAGIFTHQVEESSLTGGCSWFLGPVCHIAPQRHRILLGALSHGLKRLGQIRAFGWAAGAVGVFRLKLLDNAPHFFSWNWGWAFLICIGNAGAIDAGAHHWTSQRLASCTACRRCVWPILISAGIFTHQVEESSLTGGCSWFLGPVCHVAPQRHWILLGALSHGLKRLGQIRAFGWAAGAVGVFRLKLLDNAPHFFSWNWGWAFLICIGNAGAIDAGAHHWTSQRLASCTACRRCVWPILISAGIFTHQVEESSLTGGCSWFLGPVCHVAPQRHWILLGALSHGLKRLGQIRAFGWAAGAVGVFRLKLLDNAPHFFSWNWGLTFLICIGNAGAIDAGAHHWTSQRLASCTACRRCVWPILISAGIFTHQVEESSLTGCRICLECGTKPQKYCRSKEWSEHVSAGSDSAQQVLQTFQSPSFEPNALLPWSQMRRLLFAAKPSKAVEDFWHLSIGRRKAVKLALAPLPSGKGHTKRSRAVGRARKVPATMLEAPKYQNKLWVNVYCEICEELWTKIMNLDVHIYEHMKIHWT